MFSSTTSDVLKSLQVWTAVDMLTDEVLHHVECSEETSRDVTSVRVTYQGGGFSILLGKGLMLIIDELVPIAYRVDKGKLTRDSWQWDGKLRVAKKAGSDLGQALLEELAKGKRIAIQVADERGNIILDGAAEAVKDFRERLAP